MVSKCSGGWLGVQGLPENVLSSQGLLEEGCAFGLYSLGSFLH